MTRYIKLVGKSFEKNKKWLKPPEKGLSIPPILATSTAGTSSRSAPAPEATATDTSSSLRWAATQSSATTTLSPCDDLQRNTVSLEAEVSSHPERAKDLMEDEEEAIDPFRGLWVQASRQVSG